MTKAKGNICKIRNLIKITTKFILYLSYLNITIWIQIKLKVRSKKMDLISKIKKISVCGLFSVGTLMFIGNLKLGAVNSQKFVPHKFTAVERSLRQYAIQSIRQWHGEPTIILVPKDLDSSVGEVIVYIPQEMDSDGELSYSKQKITLAGSFISAYPFDKADSSFRAALAYIPQKTILSNEPIISQIPQVINAAGKPALIFVPQSINLIGKPKLAYSDNPMVDEYCKFNDEEQQVASDLSQILPADYVVQEKFAQPSHQVDSIKQSDLVQKYSEIHTFQVSSRFKCQSPVNKKFSSEEMPNFRKRIYTDKVQKTTHQNSLKLTNISERVAEKVAVQNSSNLINIPERADEKSKKENSDDSNDSRSVMLYSDCYSQGDIDTQEKLCD